jgi:voltage-gated potassium channel
MTPGGWEGTQRTRSLAEQRAHDEWRRISGRRGTIFDWSLLVLSAVSVGLNLWFLFGPQPPYAGSRATWHDTLLTVDLVVSVVFALAICFRWLRFRIGRIYLVRHWWEVPALVPFVIPWVGDHHWVMWIVLAARATRLADRTDNIFGDRFTAALIRHFSDPIIDAIKRPITVAMLDEVADVLKRGTYATNVKRAIGENRAELEAMILQLIKEDRTAGRLRFVPFHDEMLRSSTDTVFRILDRALDDPRTTELVSDIIATSVLQVRHAVREHR